MELVRGKYIVAVSGGVDSSALLNMLSKQADMELVVAHFDHGIRPDSGKDREFVENLAKSYDLPFEFAEGHLGAKASEELARTVRYEFLEKTRQKYQAEAIVTAHHQDDALETILLNLLRGTGRKGLSSLGNTPTIKRPLLSWSKQQLKEYAIENRLKWREDSTNLDTAYARNWVRLQLMPRLTSKQTDELIASQGNMQKLNKTIDNLLNDYINTNITKLDKRPVVELPVGMAQELVAHWLRENNLRQFDSKTIQRVVVGARTLSEGKTIELYKGWRVTIRLRFLELNKHE